MALKPADGPGNQACIFPIFSHILSAYQEQYSKVLFARIFTGAELSVPINDALIRHQDHRRFIHVNHQDVAGRLQFFYRAIGLFVGQPD